MWWRACVVWRTRTVYCLGPLLIALTFGMSCPPVTMSILVSRDGSPPAFGMKALWGVRDCVSPCRQPQMLLPDSFFVDACAVLSLAVNTIATALIGLKAWCVTLTFSNMRAEPILTD